MTSAIVATTAAPLVPKASKPEPDNSDIVIHKGLPIGNRSSSASIQVRPREITFGKKKVQTDPAQLIRLIRKVTQDIGEYKTMDGVYGLVASSALRKARADLVSILEDNFGIHWQIDPATGTSVFWM